MVRRTRDIQKKIWLTPQEERTIAKKMEMIGTENFGAYARKMLIDGYIIVVDYTEQKKLAAEINKIGVNINTVCRRINSTGRFYQDDIDELKEKMDAVWQLLKLKQSSVLIALHYIGGAGLRAAFIGRFADTDRFAIPEVDVYLDILDFSLSLQATISFQIAVKRGGRITCRLTCLLDCSYKLRETVWIGFSLANKGISPMDKTASRTSLWRS